MKKVFTLVALLMLVELFQFCSSSKKVKAVSQETATTFEANVLPLIKAKCSPCHVPPVGTKKHLVEYALAKENIDSIIRRVQLNPGEKGFMPNRKSERLPDSLIQVFVKWKADGLQEK